MFRTVFCFFNSPSPRTLFHFEFALCRCSQSYHHIDSKAKIFKGAFRIWMPFNENRGSRFLVLLWKLQAQDFPHFKGDTPVYQIVQFQPNWRNSLSATFASQICVTDHSSQRVNLKNEGSHFLPVQKLHPQKLLGNRGSQSLGVCFGQEFRSFNEYLDLLNL